MTTAEELEEWEAVTAEVERRLSELRANPRKLEPYDQADDPDWEEIRRVVTLEVQTQHQRQQSSEQSCEDVDEVLRDRFELRRELGRGAQGRTFLGFDRKTESKVAVKQLVLRDIEDWKAIELFEREAKTLRSLDHPAIPGYVDTFHLESSQGERFFLVQDFVEGEDFKTLLDQGMRFDEARAKEFLQEILKVLIYLHQLSPPVIHRDIKPSNIMRREEGSLVLIDFGAVQSVIPNEQGGSTIIGTSGYMPMEQLMGRAQPSTDLFALGATVIHLLSQRHPADLPMEKWRLQFADFVNISDPFTEYLEKMTAPHAEDRFSSARRALAALPLPGLDRRPKKAKTSSRPRPRRPSPERTRRPSPAPTSPSTQRRRPTARSKNEPAPPTGKAIETLQERFELHLDISNNDDENRNTYVGYDLQTRSKIIITERLFERMRKATAIEIFNRESKALLQLEHHSIPAYIDAFFIGSPRGKRYFLIQEFADGDDFQSLLDKSFSFDEDTTKLFLQQVLECLVYLQKCSPPVVHANIKPSTVIVRPDDTLALVDFATPWTEIVQHQGGERHIGTAGYTPLEQISGDCTTSTDLYALGMTAMHLMSRTSPPATPDSQWHRQFEHSVDSSPEFLDYLETMTAFDADDRFPNAVRALEALERIHDSPESTEEQSPQRAQESSRSRPEASMKVNVYDSPDTSSSHSTVLYLILIGLSMLGIVTMFAFLYLLM